MELYRWRYAKYFRTYPEYCEGILSPLDCRDKCDLKNLGLFSLMEMVDAYKTTYGLREAPLKTGHYGLKMLICKALDSWEEVSEDGGKHAQSHDFNDDQDRDHSISDNAEDPADSQHLESTDRTSWVGQQSSEFP